jgi:hypothetical protein
MSWNCEVCKKSFTRKQSLERHLSTTNVHDKYNESIKTYDCECGKIYKHKQSLRNHKIKCEKAIKSAEAKISEVYEQRLKTQKAEFDKERTELRNQIAMLLDKHAGNTTNNTHIETQNNNIHIQINAFGHENIDYINDKTIIKCIERVYKSIPALIEKVHFDPEHPENHNIKITNKKLPYACVMGQNKKWKTVHRKDAIETMVTNGYNILDDKYTENKESISDKKQERFEEFQEKFENEDKELHRQLKQDVELLVLNGI